MSSEDLCCQAQIQHGRIANQQEEAPYFFWKKNLQLLRGSRNHANGGNRTSLHKAPKTARGVNLQIYLEKERMVPLPSSPTRNPTLDASQHLQIRTQILHKLYKSMNAHFTLFILNHKC